LQVLIIGPIAFSCARHGIAAFGRTDNLPFFHNAKTEEKAHVDELPLDHRN
jgi:hypothetical protein